MLERTRERPNGGKRGTHRVRSDIREEQQGQRDSHENTPGVVQLGEEGVCEEHGNHNKAGPTLRSCRAYPLDDPRINQELEDEHASATRSKGLQQYSRERVDANAKDDRIGANGKQRPSRGYQHVQTATRCSKDM